MTDRIKGITIEIGGDTTNLHKALEGVNKQTKETQSQLRDVERLLKLDPKNTELLAQKQKLLTKEIEESADKLKVLKTAEQQLKDSGIDENSEQFQGLRREIIETEGKMQNLEKQAQDTGDKLGKHGKEVEKAEKSHEGLAKAAKATGTALAAAGAAAVAATAKIAKGLADSTREGAAYADTVLTESTVTGIAADKLQEYLYAEELLDVSTGTLTKSMAKNIKSMYDARNGSEKMADAYAALGIEVVDANGNLRDGDTVYWEIIDALGKMDNETERDAAAMQLLGKSAQELNPLIEAGADRVKELGDEARQTGYVLSDETLAAYGAYDDELQRLDKGAQAAKNAVGTLLLPALTDLAEDGVELITDFTNGVKEANGDVNMINEATAGVLSKIVTKVSETLPKILNMLTMILTSVVQNLPQIMQTIVPAIVDLVVMVASTLIDNIDLLLDAVGQIVLAVGVGLINAAPKLIDKLPTLIEKIVDFVIVNIPQIVSAIIKAFAKETPAILTALTKTVKSIMEQLVRLVKEGLTALKDVIKGLWDKIVGSLAKGGGVFRDIGDGLKNILKTSLNAVIKGINTVIGTPIKEINKVFDKLRSISILGVKPFSGLNWKIPVPEIPMLANGGVLSSGSAIVGEAGPELLTMANGKAVVQPLTATVDSAGLANAMKGAQQPVNVFVNFSGDLAGLGRVLAPHIETAQNITGGSLVR